MKRSILFIAILVISFSVKGQNWHPEFVKFLKEYYFVPVEFGNFGEWISGIENDSSLVFQYKIFTQVNDSLHLNFLIQKPGFSPVKKARHAVNIVGNTIYKKPLKFEPVSKNLVKILDTPARNVTVLSIYATLSFDTTEMGRIMASETQKELEKQAGIFFITKQVVKSNKIIKKRKFHPETERTAYFKRKNDIVPMFRIRTYNYEDSNTVELYLYYELGS